MLRRVRVLLLVLLGTLSISVPAAAIGPVVTPVTCSVTWTAPTTNADASLLVDLARYEVQVGTAPGVFPSPSVALAAAAPTPVPGTVTWACTGVTDGQRYARVRACDLAGNCSVWTPELPFLYDSVAPAVPTNVRVGP